MHPNLHLFPMVSKQSDVRSIAEDSSHHLRTTGLLSARSTLDIPNFAKIRLVEGGEAEALAEIARKRNVFARHSYENSFYLQRIRALSNKTVIEVVGKGDPDEMIGQAEKVTEVTERLAVLSSTFALQREKLHRLLAITAHRVADLDITIGRGFRYLRSKSRVQPVLKGITVDASFCKRFASCGFAELARFCVCNTDVALHVRTAIDWLFESRKEARIDAAIIKTAIALESLLILNESEPLAQSLSERAAFMLTSDPSQRRQISRIFRRFYEARSAVVHGSRRTKKFVRSGLLEGIDRLSLLLCLLLASNQDKWGSTESLREWCEGERWGTPSAPKSQFPKSYLKRAIALCSKAIP